MTTSSAFSAEGAVDCCGATCAKVGPAASRARTSEVLMGSIFMVTMVFLVGSQVRIHRSDTREPAIRSGLGKRGRPRGRGHTQQDEDGAPNQRQNQSACNIGLPVAINGRGDPRRARQSAEGPEQFQRPRLRAPKQGPRSARDRPAQGPAAPPTPVHPALSSRTIHLPPRGSQVRRG